MLEWVNDMVAKAKARAPKNEQPPGQAPAEYNWGKKKKHYGRMRNNESIMCAIMYNDIERCQSDGIRDR